MKALILRLFLLALLGSVLSAQSTYAQTPKIDSLKQLIENRPDDTVKIDLMFELGEEYLTYRYFDKVDSLSIEVLDLSDKVNSHRGLAANHYFRSKVLGRNGKYDKSLEELNLAENKLIENDSISLKILAFATLYKAEVYFRKYELKKAVKNVKKSLALFSTIKYSVGIARCYKGLGLIAAERGDTELALRSLLNSVDFFKIPEDNMNLAQNYNSIGTLYMEIGAYKTAIHYFEKSVNLRTSSNVKDHQSNIAIPYNNIGLAYKSLLKNEIALNYLNLSIKSTSDESFRSTALSNISMIHFNKREYQKALELNTKVIKNFQPESNPRGYVIHLKNRGLFLLHLGRKNEAIASLNNAIYFIKKNYHIKSSTYFDIYSTLSDVYYKKDDLDSALYYVEKGLALRKDRHVFNVQSILLVMSKLKILFIKNRLIKNSKALQDVLSEIDHYCTLIDKQKKSYTQFNDKIELSKLTIEIYNLATLTCEKLYNITNEKHYLQKALTYIEKAKALTFSQSMLDYRAKEFSGIPDSLQEKEKELKIDVAFYQSKISETREETGYDSVYVQELENKLFDSNRAYEVLLEKLENDYPKYHDLKYKTQTIEIEQIQQQLSDNTAVVEYLMGDTTLHVFTITKEDFELQSLPIDSSLSKNITVLQQEFQQGSTKSQLGVDFDKFTTLSHEIYQTILEPALTRLNKKDINRLIIIPDDKLWQVNFELLLTGESTATDFKELPYLLRDYSVSYGYSSTLLFGEQYKNDQELIQECLAFSFTDSTNLTHGDHLPLRTLRNVDIDLPGSRKEVQAISTVLEGEYYYGASANKQTFKEKAENYAILHLALHGEVDDKEPMNSKLYFTPSSDSSENNSLYAYELYNMSLNAELAVLSACNTGSGQLASGEGIMSLGRAFSYAGVRSLLVSHWDVSDKASPEIMESFYKGLKQGLSKDEALRQAKLAYLENSDIYMANPFFWGGFVVMGDSTAMEFEDGYNWWVIASVVSLLLVVGIFLVGRRRHEM